MRSILKRHAMSESNYFISQLQLTAIIWYFQLNKQIAMDNFRSGRQKALVSRVSETKVQTRECQVGVELSFKVR